MQPFFALVTPVGNGGSPSHPIAGPPPGVVSPPIYYPPYPSTGPGFPTNPIAPGGLPPGVAPPIFYPPYPSTGPGFPTNPIAPGGQPPTVGWTPPGTAPSHPISGGGYVIGWSPVFGYVAIPIGGAQPIAPGGEGGVPTHPIAGGEVPEPK